MLDKILNDEARSLYCLDLEKEGEIIKMLGDRSDDSFTRLDIIVAPCNYLNAYAGHDGDPIAPGCIRDLDA